MKNTSSALILVIAALIFIPASAEGSTAISTLGSATATNTFDNANYTQTWTWNTEAGYGLSLTSNSTALGNGAAVLFIHQGGSSSVSGATSMAAEINNKKTKENQCAADYDQVAGVPRAPRRSAPGQ